METTTQELIYQLLLLVVTGVITVIGAYAKKYITAKIDFEKYGFENDKVERIIDNAVNYVEQKAKEKAKAGAYRLASNDKLDMARAYINKVDKGVVEKYGAKLDVMIERKVAQVVK